nr:hypothetical protein [Brevibacterium sp. FME17]
MSAQQTHRRVLRRLLRLLAEVGDGFESGIREEDNRRGDEDTDVNLDDDEAVGHPFRLANAAQGHPAEDE